MKSLVESKTFWVNLLTLAGTVAGVLPAKYAAPALAVVNIGLRLITNTAIYGLFK